MQKLRSGCRVGPGVPSPVTLSVPCSLSSAEWDHPSARGLQKGEHKHGEAPAGPWWPDRCQNQGECPPMVMLCIPLSSRHPEMPVPKHTQCLFKGVVVLHLI